MLPAFLCVGQADFNWGNGMALIWSMTSGCSMASDRSVDGFFLTAVARDRSLMLMFVRRTGYAFSSRHLTFYITLPYISSRYLTFLR